MGRSLIITAAPASADAERLIFIPSLISNTMRRTNRPAFQQAISFDSHR
jgi:hypothetical protein